MIKLTLYVSICWNSSKLSLAEKGIEAVVRLRGIEKAIEKVDDDGFFYMGSTNSWKIETLTEEEHNKYSRELLRPKIELNEKWLNGARITFWSH